MVKPPAKFAWEANVLNFRPKMQWRIENRVKKRLKSEICIENFSKGLNFEFRRNFRDPKKLKSHSNEARKELR